MKTIAAFLADNPRASRHDYRMAELINGTSGVCYAASPMPPQAPQTQITPADQNRLARDLIFAKAKPILQQVVTQAFAAPVAGQNTLSVRPLPIGFLRRFIVVVTGTLNNTGAGALTLSKNGNDNLLSNITFTDFTGNPRHNASGRAFGYVEACKYGRVPGAAYTTDSPSGYGSIIASNVAPATINNASAATVTRVYEIPIMVDTGKNMAGGMWLGVNNQSCSLNLTINPNPVVLATADNLAAVYTAGAGGTGTLTNVTITVFQDYWNNVPEDPKTGQPILPMNDIGTAYMITETNSGLAFAANQPAQWNFPTFSKLLGTYFAYNNGGVTLNPGTDLSQVSLVVSNYSIIKQYTPQTLSRVTRDTVNADLPAGQYALQSRMHNLDVSQYPSLQLQITPITAAAGSYALITTELLRPMQYMASASGVGGA